MAPERIYTDPDLRMKVEAVLQRAYNEVKALIEEHGAAVIAVAEALIAREDLTGEDVEQLIRQADGMPMQQASLDQIAVAALSAPMVPPMVQIRASIPGYAPQMLPQPWRRRERLPWREWARRRERRQWGEWRRGGERPAERLRQWMAGRLPARRIPAGELSAFRSDGREPPAGEPAQPE